MTSERRLFTIGVEERVPLRKQEIDREAHQDATNVSEFLHSLTEAGWDVSGLLDRDSLLKLAALIRLRRWERSGVLVPLAANLPTADAVLRDVLKRGPARYCGSDLRRDLLRFQFTRLSWRPWPQGDAEIALASRGPPTDILEAVARFLWQFRHLGQEETR